MKNLFIFLFSTAVICFAGKMNVNFNDGTPTAEIDFSAIDNIEIFTPPAGMVFVEGGTFEMGDEIGDLPAKCRPVHQVTLNSIYISKCEITQSEWVTFMPSATYDFGSGSNYPVYYVSWYAIIKYCNLRSMAEGITPCYTISGSTDPANWGTVPTSSNSTWDAAICNWSANGYRLPTEAEWEYAARGGIYNNDGYLYSGSNIIGDVAWYASNNNPSGTKAVGTKASNQLEISDMNGNLWELCWDWYGTYLGTAQTNPTGATTGSYRVLRGGCYANNPSDCRVASRLGSVGSSYYDAGCGFRVARKY